VRTRGSQNSGNRFLCPVARHRLFLSGIVEQWERLALGVVNVAGCNRGVSACQHPLFEIPNFFGLSEVSLVLSPSSGRRRRPTSAHIGRSVLAVNTAFRFPRSAAPSVVSDFPFARLTTERIPCHRNPRARVGRCKTRWKSHPALRRPIRRRSAAPGGAAQGSKRSVIPSNLRARAMGPLLRPPPGRTQSASREGPVSTRSAGKEIPPDRGPDGTSLRWGGPGRVQDLAGKQTAL
jgi:hypothetical protein